MSYFVTGEIVEVVLDDWFDPGTYAIITIGQDEYSAPIVLALGFRNGKLDEEGCGADEFKKIVEPDQIELRKIVEAANKRDPKIIDRVRQLKSNEEMANKCIEEPYFDGGNQHG